METRSDTNDLEKGRDGKQMKFGRTTRYKTEGKGYFGFAFNNNTGV